MTQVYLPIGLPGCGKSTLADNLIARGVLDADAVVSTDALRRICTGHHSLQNENGTVFAITRKLVCARLRNDLDTWVDATNLSEAWRSEMAEFCRLYDGKLIFVLFETPFEEAQRRNLEREVPVPEAVMNKMFKEILDIAWEALPGYVVSSDDLYQETS